MLLKDFIENKLENDRDSEHFLPTNITKVCAGNINTLILSDTGDLFIFGNDEYWQSGRSKEMKELYQKELNMKKKSKNKVHLLTFLSSPIPIIIPNDKKIKIADISIGSHHIVAVSNYYEMFSWGRNDEGQLGQGFISAVPVATPKIGNNFKINFIVESMLRERVRKVYAAENYSACLTSTGKLFTCGSGEFGKLGNGISKDTQIDFEQVETECPIAFVSLGINHMAAIADYDENDPKIKDGRTLVWGRNQKGQLGTGTTEQSSSPVELINLNAKNVRLISAHCGVTFTIGITSKKRLIYFGDKRFWIKPQKSNDILEPIELEVDSDDVEDISVWYNKVLLRIKNGKVFEWGYYLYGMNY